MCTFVLFRASRFGFGRYRGGYFPIFSYIRKRNVAFGCMGVLQDRCESDFAIR